MKIKNKVMSVIIALTQAKWIPTLMTLTFLAAGLGVEGCGSHSH